MLATQQLGSGETDPADPRWLAMMWLELTPRCNLSCLHCYADSGPTVADPGVVDWKSVMKQGRELGCSLVQFIGGEATIHPRFWDYAEYASACGFDVTEVYSNLTTLTRQGARRLAELGFSVATSFYSPSAEVHDRITRQKGSFGRTCRGIDNALSAGIDLRVGLVDIGVNSSDLKGAVDFLTGLGVRPRNIGHERLREVGRGATMARGNSIGRTLCGYCWMGKLAVTPSGIVYPCVMARDMPVGNVGKMSLEQILSSPTLRMTRLGIKTRFPTEGLGGDCCPDGGMLRHDPPVPLRHDYAGRSTLRYPVINGSAGT